MITEENGVFHIRTETYSYLFKIDTYGLAEHLHFGAPVKTRDAGALSCRPGLGWGASILLDAKDAASCPDVLPLEWSGSGRRLPGIAAGAGGGASGFPLHRL